MRTLTLINFASYGADLIHLLYAAMLLSFRIAGGLRQIFLVSMRILSKDACLFKGDIIARLVRYDYSDIVDRFVFLEELENLYQMRDISTVPTII